MRRAILMYALAILCPMAPTYASDWQWIASTNRNNGHIGYDDEFWAADKESLRASTEFRYVWIRRNKITTNPDGGEGWTAGKTLYATKCSEKSIAAISDITYNEKGEVIKSLHFAERDLRFEPVVPDSMAEAVLNFACDNSIAQPLTPSRRK